LFSGLPCPEGGAGRKTSRDGLFAALIFFIDRREKLFNGFRFGEEKNAGWRARAAGGAEAAEQAAI
jgi:hypothetical protein